MTVSFASTLQTFEHYVLSRARFLRNSLKMHSNPAGGDGRLASPPSYVSSEATPVVADITVTFRSPDFPELDGYVLKKFKNEPDGSWTLDELSQNVTYDIIGRYDIKKDVIVPKVTPAALHPEASAWKKRVMALNGGVSPTDPELDLVNGLAIALNAASYGSKIKYLLPFVGDTIAKQQVPLRDFFAMLVATNSGFTDSDADTTTGLANPTEAAKILDTKILPSWLGEETMNGGIGWWERNIGYGTGVEPVGVYSLAASSKMHCIELRNTNCAFIWGDPGNAAQTLAGADNDHYYGQRESSTIRKIFVNGSLIDTNTTADTAAFTTERSIRAMGCRLGNNLSDVGDAYWNGTGGVMYLTDGSMSDADVAAFHTLLDTYLITPTGR